LKSTVSQAIQGQTSNHLLPFLWMHEGVGTEVVRNEVRAARQSGAREVCVESRPHENFCEEEWWRDMDALLDEAQKLDMRVWILDDKHFPTGYANGLVPKKYPQLRKWHLAERCVDVTGPMKDAAMLLPPLFAEHEESLVGIYAYARQDQGKPWLGSACVDLTDHVKNGYLFWDIPEGIWRIFYLIKTRLGTKQKNYVHLIDPQSVHVLIEAVYEPHYQRYGHLFGNTIAGFFSDEPSFGNQPIDWHRGPHPGMYSHTVGQQGLALPWTEDVLRRMSEELGRDATPLLPLIWYDGEGMEKVRIAYMNAVTFAWRDAFSLQLGNWCRERNVLYIGHIIEDMNAHARLSCSGGHYFRSLQGQDMSGIDVVLHQIMPGMSHIAHTASGFGNNYDGNFFDYVLAKLAASAAHLEPLKEGRAMCEVFGAYGWAEGTPFMKYLMDHMLVRGINRFVPHAFSPAYPDPDCPPHFFAGGDNPQFPGFARLMDYTNFTASLLEGGTHVAQAAILYHAEAEWSGREYELMEKPARVLYDQQIDFDIVSLDMLENAHMENGQLAIHDHRFQALVVPGCRYLPMDALKRLAKDGLSILFTDFKPEDAPGVVTPLANLPKAFRRDVIPMPAFPLLRSYHVRQDGRDVYMFVNESVSDTFDGNVHLDVRGDYALLEKQLESYTAGSAPSGIVPLTLAPTQSAIVVFGDDVQLPARTFGESIGELTARWQVSRASHKDLAAIAPDPFADPALVQADTAKFVPVYEGETLINMTGPVAPGDVHFSGLFKYEADVELNGADVIDLGHVGQTARLLLNGVDLGLRMSPPYRFDLRSARKDGLNHLEIQVGNTLVHAHNDGLSFWMQTPPSGLLGPVRLIEYKK